MKTLFVSTLCLALVFGSTGVAKSDPNDAIENVAAIAASQNVCGFNANEEMVEVAIRSLIGDPRDIKEGGRYWPNMRTNFNRIIQLTSTDSGRLSFCARVKRDLFSFFD